MYRYEMGAVIASVQAKHGLHSHEAIGTQLGVTAKTVSNWLHGRNYPDDRTIALLAELAELDREAFAAYIQAQRSPTPEGRETWLRAMRRLLGSANIAVPLAMVLIALGAVLAPAEPAQAGELSNSIFYASYLPLELFVIQRLIAARKPETAFTVEQNHGPL